MSKTYDIKWLPEGFRQLITSNEMFRYTSKVTNDTSNRIRGKTRAHVFRGSKDKRPLGAIWSDAKTEEELYKTKNQMRGVS